MPRTQKTLFTAAQSILFYLLINFILTACASAGSVGPNSPSVPPAENASPASCPVTGPEWVKPPDDPAVDGAPDFGYYFVNQDRSIWASAWWQGQAEQYLRAGDDGVKVGWFRPAGEELSITGLRIDGEAPPLDAHVPCCYPTRFQATGLAFPTAGCWEITANAAGSELTFVVSVYP